MKYFFFIKNLYEDKTFVVIEYNSQAGAILRLNGTVYAAKNW